MRRNLGIGLIEVMITAFILAVGLLAVVAMQGLAKQSSYEAQQRTYAMLMAKSMVERINLNSVSWVDQGDVDTAIDESTTLTLPSCAETSGLLSGCNEADVIAADLYLWQQNITSSSLESVSGCIDFDSSSGDLTVLVSWNSRTSMTTSATACGSSGNTRRTVTLNSSVVL